MNSKKRIFVVLLKQTNPDPHLNLNDLSGTGRLDLLCRVITNVFFLGGGHSSFRKDNELIIYFQSYGKKLLIKGNEIKGLNPDERSQAGILRKVFSGQKINGFDFKPGKWSEILNMYPNCCVLDSSGKMVKEGLSKSNIFLIGDHIGLTSEEIEMFSTDKKISLGKNIYLASQCITLINYFLDKKE